MFKLIKLAFKLAIFLAIFLIGYNFFFGNPEERENSKAIVGQVKDLGGSVFGLLSSEKTKFQNGKYNGAFEKISGRLVAAKDYAAGVYDNGRQWNERLNQLEQQKQWLEGQLGTFDANGNPPVNATGVQQFTLEQFDAEIQRIDQQTEVIIGEMQQGQ